MAHNLTLTSPTYDTTTPKFGTACLSGGVGATSTGTGVMGTGSTGTWEFWMKQAAPTGGIQVIVGSIGNRYIGVEASGAPRFNIQNPDTSISGTVSICDGNWHHVAMVTTASGFKGYVDGVQVATSSTVNNAAETNPFYVMELDPGAPFIYSGELDEVATWNFAKYTSTFTPPSAPYVGNESGLLALYHLDSNGNDSAGAGPGPATAITMSGPSGGLVGVASTNFTIGANGTITGTITVTPSSGGGGGTFSPTSVNISSGTPTATFTYTPASTGAKTISVTNNGGLSNPTNITYTVTSSGGSINPNNAAILYSPCNWNVTGSAAIAINSGAYFSFLTDSTSATINFDVSGNVAPLPQILYRIDGGPWTSSVIASTVSLTMRSDSTALPWHSVEVMVKSTTETQNRWNGVAAAVKMTSISLSSGANVAAPNAKTGKVLFFGDSITEAVRTLGTSGTDTFLNDASTGWAANLGEMLGQEFGVIGFGATGFTVAGSGGVPALPTSIQSIYNGVARDWTGVTGVVINDGTNDGTNNTVSAVTSVLNYIFTQAPSCLVVVMRPFNGTSQAANLQAGIAACSKPSSVTYIDTAGVFDTTFGGDGLHPTAPNNILRIAPTLIPQVRAALLPHRFTVVAA